MSKKRNNVSKNIITILAMIIFSIGTYLGIIKYENVSVNTNQEQAESSTIIESKGNLIVDYIDVGQADSILIRNEDKAMLIDAGNNKDGKNVVNFLKERGVKKLDYLVGTHPHADHVGGMDNVINSDIEIDKVLMPKIQTNTKTFEDVLDALKNKKLKVTAPKKGDIFNLGTAQLEVMTDSILDKDNLNLSSIVLRLTFGENTFLFTGDAEKENEEQINWPKTDVLKVGHHGSATSSTERFVNQVKPEIRNYNGRKR